MCFFFLDLLGIYIYIAVKKTKDVAFHQPNSKRLSTLASRQEDESSGPGHQSVPPSEVSGENLRRFLMLIHAAGVDGKEAAMIYGVYIYTPEI